MRLQPVFENEDYVAYNKPSGLRSIPDRYQTELPCLYATARKQHEKLFIVHRLDKDTSGLICFAKTEAAHRHLSMAFENRQVEKFYMAIVQGAPFDAQGSIREPIGPDPIRKGYMQVQKKGKPAHTDFERLRAWKNYALLQLQLHTGRTHQIRVHLAFAGHPVLCDALYGGGAAFLLSSVKKGYKLAMDELDERPLLNRLALHASSLRFEDEAGKMLNLTAPLPKDISATVSQLDKWNSL